MDGYNEKNESDVFRNKQTGELVHYGGDIIHSRSQKFAKLILRAGSDCLEEISLEEFKLHYEMVWNKRA